MDIKEYSKYRWFFTSSGKLVVGGKSAEQNDSLLDNLKKSVKEYWVMHTSEPGSPFSVIIAPIKSVKSPDIEECAIFTGCFSRAWRSMKKITTVDIFKFSQLAKEKTMKTGTWGVMGKVERKKVELKLVLTRQKGILRAVPEQTVKSKKDILLKISPGTISKNDILPKLQLELDENLSGDEVLSALPSGGFSVSK